MPELSTQDIQRLQGTRKSETPPWMSYSAELDDQADPRLAQEVAEYAKHHHAETSSQNQEELCRQRELNVEVAKQYQWLHPSEYAEEGPRIGKVLSHSEFINRLRDECHVRCWYRQHPQPGKLTLLYQVSGGLPLEVACWAQYGQMPEFSFVRFDDHGIPLDERRRGWRTCLLQMILKGIVSEETAERVFGRATGPASERYNATLYGWRNRRMTIKEEQ